MDKYKERGVSSKKEDVHNAIGSKIDKGLFPHSFCKIVEDIFGNNAEYCNVMHADGAGTKSSLAYIYFKETGDMDVFKGIVMDSIIMNIDDLLCVGATGNFILSNTLGRNSYYVSGDIIKTIIHAYQDITEWLTKMGISTYLAGGETADVGDLVRTLIVDSTIAVRMKRKEVISNEKIKPGMVIVGFSSSGKSKYEKEYNSGIGSNGLTSARHDLLSSIYKEKYPESFDNNIPSGLAYCGPFKLTDTDDRIPINIGKALLSPTRTYSPIIKKILENYRDEIGGMVHCTGGGQTKCLNFGEGLHFIKNDLFDLPPIFQILKDVSGTSLREMYQVFNMGHRLEIYSEKNIAEKIIDISKSFDVEAKIIGEIKESSKNRLTIMTQKEEIEYN